MVSGTTGLAFNWRYRIVSTGDHRCAQTAPVPGALWGIVEGCAILLMIVTGVWFLWRDFIVWWFNVDIITNKRIIRWSGFLSPARKEYPIEKIQQIAVDARETPGEILLGYGDLHLYIVGGEIDIKQVWRPQKVRRGN